MHNDRFRTASLNDQRIIRILESALAAVEPAGLVRQYLAGIHLPAHSRCLLLGLGKAAEGMTLAAADALERFEAALVVTKRITSAAPPRFTVLESGHPIPDQRSIAAGRAILEFVARLEPTDLLVCLISGGGSALAASPVEGVTLPELQALTESALESGADIEEVNNLRRCLDRLKGGGLAAATRAQVLALLLSDVIGDRMEAIASGPTVPSQPDPIRAQRLLQSMSTTPPAAIMRHLDAGVHRNLEPKKTRIRNVIIGNAPLAADGARLQALREGFIAEVMDTAFRGEAHATGRMLGQRLATASRSGLEPACVIDYGESTVTLSADHGLGGRNQELALAAVEPLDGATGCILLAMATDGEDGPGDAAGAVVTGTTASRARALRMPATAFLARHDSYRYFDALGDLLRPGSTGTNVNDLVLSIAL